MKKSITIESKTDWEKIKEIFGDFRFIKSQLEENRENCKEFKEFWEYVEDFSDYQIDLKEFDVPLSEITDGRFKDVTWKHTTIKIESDGPCDFRWICNNLGSIEAEYNLSEHNIKITIDFKPKFGFAISMFLKGLFMACPIEELESGIQELVNDFDNNIKDEDF